ncbi:Tetratricopeptide repeat-containing protein [Hyunsoonleella jejuensis]|uniref:Tetratricopeptide repeat-containing protein n=1 Tax=Hyunsoonleella jejuensis TaxID=419940 RepID=A0A1H9A6J9_9FLAO|nr:tetratricopeptide repeat protein [Hyunsoonleella jejuensis]SEP72366.1 Tetratricopeptide repeat-containing protein [Hyunsoonleella jejuensis]
MRLLVYLLLCIPTLLVAQDDLFAKEYYKNGDFEKALIEYKKLYNTSKSNITYIKQIIDTHQQLEQYKEAEAFINEIINRTNYPAFYVSLGYNYQLQDNIEKANEHYTIAINSLLVNPNNAYSVARTFQDYSLLEQAATTYEKAMELKPELNLKLPLAQIYGEQGNIEKMMLNYIDFAERNPISLNNIKRALSSFISEDGDAESNVILRKLLIKKIQQEPNVLWNELLSWLFVQQKDFNKSFTQEKAINTRIQEGLDRILNLGRIAEKENATETAKTIFNYVVENAQDNDTKLKAFYDLLQIETKQANTADYKELQSKYLQLFDTYGKFAQTLDLQLSYAHFLAFNMSKTEEATAFLEEALKLPINDIQKAEIKLELGDILVLKEEFNKALIYYTQIQRNLKNSTVSQMARFKVAKASYYKGDFKWAESQLKILKSSTSQLIANDALELKLLISDNKYEDSLQTPLKQYAKADLLAFQNRNDEAIDILNKVIEVHKTEPIIPQALYKQAQLFEVKQQFEKAAANYQFIIDNFRDGILADNAIYSLAELYLHHLNAPEKAKELYKELVFNYADSIYFIEARKQFRRLRGDAIN